MKTRFAFLLLLLAVAAPSLQAATIPLIWDSVTDATVTELRVYELTGSGRTLLATLPRTATNYDILNRTPAQYRFTVVAYNGFWESADFDVISTPAPPGKVNGLKFGVILAAAFGGMVFVASGGVKLVTALWKKIF
jgi:hypothetical protein